MDDARLVVVAELIDEYEERVEIESPVKEHSGIFRDDTIRTYDVVDVLHADAEVGGQVKVWLSGGVDNEGQGLGSLSWETPDAEPGQRYVLFLTEFERKGEPIWGSVGEPSSARLQGEDLEFIATDRYTEDSAEGGGQGVGAAGFDVTLADLRDMLTEADEGVRP